jgi:hypothetical protein
LMDRAGREGGRDGRTEGGRDGGRDGRKKISFACSVKTHTTLTLPALQALCAVLHQTQFVLQRMHLMTREEGRREEGGGSGEMRDHRNSFFSACTSFTTAEICERDSWYFSCVFRSHNTRMSSAVSDFRASDFRISRMTRSIFSSSNESRSVPLSRIPPKPPPSPIRSSSRVIFFPQFSTRLTTSRTLQSKSAVVCSV